VDVTTADLFDRYPEAVRVCEPLFRDYGGRRRFSGPASTVKCFEDNTQVKAALSDPGQGRVLVVDAGGSMRCAMLGDRIAASAVANGWTGVLLSGCVRDSARLAAMDIGVKALGSIPRRSVRRGEGQREIPVSIGGLTVAPGDFVYCDEDGVLISTEPLI
jgi:regulator of ribonuclease activity A